MDREFVVGVIGAGRIGKIHIENLIRKVPNVKLKTVADIKIDAQLKQWADKKGISNLTTKATEIFEDPEIDVVIIASSTETHAKFIQEAAIAQKHVFCEKPIDTDLKRIKETLKIVKNEGIKLMVGFNRRFDRNFMRVHEAVASGQIGTPQIIKITSRDPAPPPIEYIKVSGGIFIDMTIHDWDMARYQACSEVEEVYASGAVLIDPEIGKAGDIDTAVAVLKFKNGALGIIDNTRQAVYGYDQRVEVLGSKGCVLADNEATNTVRIYTAECTNIDKIPYFFLERYMESYATELKSFFNCLQNNQDPTPNGEDSLQDVLIAMAAQKSFKENRPVKISEIDK
ncbi:MAG: inositol 2-dehydrogenase [Promethearchaeota archaeon]|nr:MAG: inositol 2-dehydrogenase [Candidatus Lokiarchaeota archaeon]